MALIRRNENQNMFPDVQSMFNRFFDEDVPGLFSKEFKGTVPAVNIKENKDNYEISVAAPGLNKEDFRVNVKDNMLTISSEKEDEKEDKGDEFTRREFSYSSFNRTFTLPDSVKQDKIEARYEDGILKIDIPKKEESKEKPAKEIKIS